MACSLTLRDHCWPLPLRFHDLSHVEGSRLAPLSLFICCTFVLVSLLALACFRGCFFSLFFLWLFLWRLRVAVSVVFLVASCSGVHVLASPFVFWFVLPPTPSDHDNFCLPRNMAFVVIERTSCHPTKP